MQKNLCSQSLNSFISVFFPFLSDFQSLPLLEYFMTDQLILGRPLELLSLDSIASLLTPSENS